MKALLSVGFSGPLVRPSLVKSFVISLRSDPSGDVVEEVTVDPESSDADSYYVADLETPVDLGAQVSVEVVSVGRFQSSAPVIVSYKVPESVTPGEVSDVAVLIRDVLPDVLPHVSLDGPTEPDEEGPALEE